MENSVQKLSSDCDIKLKKLPSSRDETISNGKTLKSFETRKEVNSWDCSTPSDTCKTPKKKPNDWDSSSDCHETMVEAFGTADNFNCDDWDSESEKTEPKNEAINPKETLVFVASSLDSFFFSNPAFDDVSKSSPSSSTENERDNKGGKSPEKDSLLVEDFEDYVKGSADEAISNSEESPPSTPATGSGTLNEKVRSSQSEGTPEDSTIWMIPKSERTESGESTSKLISSSDREKIEKQNRFKDFLKKTKSLSDMQKSNFRRRMAKSSRSEDLGSEKNNYNTFLLCEESNLQRKLEIESKPSKETSLGCEKFHRTRVFFTECKAMTIDKDVPEKLSRRSSSAGITDEGLLPEEIVGVPDEDPPNEKPVESKEGGSETVQPEPSGVASVSSTPSSQKVRDSVEGRHDGDVHQIAPKEKGSHMPASGSESTVKTQMSESWFLFDDAGQYQEISKNEVSILFNGRSADAVLQGKAEHFIPTATLKNTGSLRDSLSQFGKKESHQHVFGEDDIGGDDEFKKLIDLERKVENTLFYIRPETDHKASIRIIPVNAEMIHIWRRTKDGGTSSVSFEADSLSQPHDSTETAHLRPNRISSSTNQPRDELTPNQENEVQPSETTPVQPSSAVPPEFQHSQSSDFSKLLIETRVIVDTLTHNFRTLQTRLDGETNRSMALQGELSKLRLLMKTHPEDGKRLNGNPRETNYDFTNPGTTASLLTLKASDKVDIRSEGIIEEEEETEEFNQQTDLEVQDKSTSIGGTEIAQVQFEGTQKEESPQDGNNFITVNIYTVEGAESLTPFTDSSHETYSLAQSNLKLIENKMKRLQQENITITRQNMELKRKLKEISLELEKYLTSTSEQDASTEESRDLETLREQVSVLKLELENMKTLAKDQEDILTEENHLIREEFARSLAALNDWCGMAEEVFRKIQTANSRLEDTGIAVDANLEPGSIQNPKHFCTFLSSYLEQTHRCLFTIKDENFLYEQALKDVQKDSGDGAKEISGLDKVISGYSELIEQCRRGQITGETKNKVMEDYFAVIMEKASLMEEVKILKTENEMLLESQLEHYEKLKQTMIALKDRKSEITALESSQKLSEDEKTRMADVLKLCQEEKKQVDAELLEKSKTIEDLIEEKKNKDLEIRDCHEKLKAALGEIKSFEKSCRLKDEMIKELRAENEELLCADGAKKNEIENLNDLVKNLEMQGSQLEAELSSTKLFVSESQKEMTDYITHLEALVNTSQESLEKTKQKLKETNQTINRLKTESDVLEKQHQCDVKLFNSTKDELDSCREKLAKVTNKLKESEEAQEKLSKKCESLACSEKQKSEALESLAKEYKIALEENADLREKVEIYSKDKEELLSEQKDLISKYGLLSKEIQKLQEKYRSVKTECNERTDLIRYMEMMLKENLLEYNNRIACLEQNISRIIEKIVAYKNGLKEKHSGVDPEVRELRHQLSITCQERKELENVVDNYYTLMKHLENEIQEREKKVDELHMKLSLEQQKAVEGENERSFHGSEASKTAEMLKIEQLESQVAVTENELGECKREMQKCQTNYENEKKKLELTIADLRSEIKRYQLRIEVMMRNLSNCSKNMNGLVTDKRNEDDSDLQSLKKEIREKEKTIAELNDTLIKCKAEVKLKDGDLENFKKKSFYQSEELKNLQNKIAQLEDAVSVTNKATEFQQKEKDEMAEKLFQSIKLIMEERSTRQNIESLALEKEKNYKNQIDQMKNELILKAKECESLSEALEDKKKLVNKLQDDLRKAKVELNSLKAQVSNYKKRNSHTGIKKEEEQLLHACASLAQIKSQHVSPERLESCLKELKEVRDLNLELRKMEGQYQAKVVRLEDEVRDARLLIKELQGDIKTEKKSKKAFKNMILAAKMEIEKCVMAKQLMSVVAERISRHLDLSEIPSRELLSGFRLSDSSSSLKICS